MAEYKAKQMKPIDPKGVSTKGEYQADRLDLTGRPCKPAAGENPKSAMIDGPFGGKKPQG